MWMINTLRGLTGFNSLTTKIDSRQPKQSIAIAFKLALPYMPTRSLQQTDLFLRDWAFYDPRRNTYSDKLQRASLILQTIAANELAICRPPARPATAATPSFALNYSMQWDLTSVRARCADYRPDRTVPRNRTLSAIGGAFMAEINMGLAPFEGPRLV